MTHMTWGHAPFGGFLMMFLFLLLLVGLFLLYRRGRFGPPPWARGPYAQRPWGADAAAGRPAEAAGQQGWFGPWGQQPQPRPEDEALKVLADRLAAGDITPDEYLERVGVLRQQQP
nr:SHOCT domain-containing protein [Propionibacterium sp.]